jgi:hypothetical protein
MYHLDDGEARRHGAAARSRRSGRRGACELQALRDARADPDLPRSSRLSAIYARAQASRPPRVHRLREEMSSEWGSTSPTHASSARGTAGMARRGPRSLRSGVARGNREEHLTQVQEQLASLAWAAAASASRSSRS